MILAFKLVVERKESLVLTTNEVHDVQVGLGMPALANDSGVPGRSGVLAAHKDNDGDENVQGRHGDDQKPQQGVNPTLGGQTHESQREGDLAHGAGHDDERLGDLT